ncbi:hypothetical protein JVV71_22170, partial [Vibrio cholerae O1]|nr:hypothetical protein [Vibrio cholerae O1]
HRRFSPIAVRIHSDHLVSVPRITLVVTLPATRPGNPHREGDARRKVRPMEITTDGVDRLVRRCRALVADEERPHP